MAYEILKSIVEAEARAVEIKKQAVAQAEERKADALKQQEILKILKEAEEACSQIREQAAQRKEEAVLAVIGKVVGEYGSC